MTHDTQGQTYGRRTVLKAMGVAGAAAVGGTATTQPAAAGKGGDCDPDETPPVIYTADHVDTNFWGSVGIEDGHSETDYDFKGPTFPEGVDELVVHCHGWRNDASCGIHRINTTRDAYEFEGYRAGVVSGLVWDSSYAWWNAKEIADINGTKLANFLIDYKRDNPDTTLRLQGHSLGARVVAETIYELYQQDENTVVTTAIFMGGAIENTSVSIDGRYGHAIENAVQHAENFWMQDDTVLDWAFTTYEFSSAIGNDGCDGVAPRNYTDHHIQLDDHSDHYKPGRGVVDEAILTFQEETGDGGPGGPGSGKSDDDDQGGGGPGFTIPAVAAGAGGATLLKRYRDDE